MQVSRSKLLKKDVFGRIDLVRADDSLIVRRDAAGAATIIRWLARRLLAREARALAVLDGIIGIPELIRATPDTLDRSFIDGLPMHEGKPTDPRYFQAAARLLRQLHRRNVVHNDLAKEPNLLVVDGAQPAIIDFQLAWFAPARGHLFRTLAREDIRHLLKHKRTYCPQNLTRREQDILNNPSILAKVWMQTGKPVYLFVTRRVLGWQDREGAGERT